MPAKAATTQNSQVNPGRRRFLNLDLLVKITVPLLLIFLLLIALEMELVRCIYPPLSKQCLYNLPGFCGSTLYFLAFLTMQLVRTVLWWRYRPFLPPGPLPKVTVPIPAYNEGAMVEKALYSVAAVRLPR